MATVKPAAITNFIISISPLRGTTQAAIPVYPGHAVTINVGLCPECGRYGRITKLRRAATNMTQRVPLLRRD
jgi:hypothetical protein